MAVIGKVITKLNYSNTMNTKTRIRAAQLAEPVRRLRDGQLTIPQFVKYLNKGINLPAQSPTLEAELFECRRELAVMQSILKYHDLPHLPGRIERIRRTLFGLLKQKHAIG